MSGNGSRAASGASSNTDPTEERTALNENQAIADASHNLRQPLQSISMLNAALSQQTEDPELLKIVALQRKSLDEVIELLESLLEACSPALRGR